MILIIDNGMNVNIINYYLKKLKYNTFIINSSDMTIKTIDHLDIEAIIISNGIDRKEIINNTLRIIQNYVWKVPILGIGIGAITLGLLFNAKICDSKINNIVFLEINHDERTIYNDIRQQIKCTKWCKFAISDELFKKTDLEISARYNKEIISFRHKNLAIEGVLFDVTSLSCECGKDVFKNFLKYYIKK